MGLGSREQGYSMTLLYMLSLTRASSLAYILHHFHSQFCHGSAVDSHNVRLFFNTGYLRQLSPNPSAPY